MQARRIRPDTGPIDRRRLTAAVLSAVLPGLGQAFNGRRRLALAFLIPSLILIAIGLIVVRTQSTTRLVAWAIEPAILGTLLTLNLVLLAWRLVASGQAFLDTKRVGPTGRLGAIGMLVIAFAVLAPHVLVWRYGMQAGETFAKVFAGQVLSASTDHDEAALRPALTDRINVLLIGVDSTKQRNESLTDTMMVVSLDPVGHSISMVSLPRDLVSVPLGDGNVYGPKLNSLLSYAERNPETFPKGGIRTLEAAVGALLGIQIQYYARIDFSGFIDMVDAVGGVDITVKKDLVDPTYDGFGLGQRGFSIAKGTHHLTGAEALAYARIRKPLGESDFTRAARQQQILVALKEGATDSGGGLLWELPRLLDAVGKTIKTDLPPELLPDLAAVVDEMKSKGVTKAVINHPLVSSKTTRYGSSLVPDLTAIRAMAAKLFSPVGVKPVPWPTPKPTPTPKATAKPSDATPPSEAP